MLPPFETLVDLVEWTIIRCEYAWLSLQRAWLESEIEYLDRQIAKYQMIIARCDTPGNGPI
jgi:hypothetical protein